MQNVSFVAQTADWIPEMLYEIIRAAFHHNGLSFIRIMQRCPEWMPDNFEPWLHDPSRVHAAAPPDVAGDQPRPGPDLPEPVEHDPTNIHRAREIASELDPIPVGILYHNPSVPRYEETVRSEASHSTSAVRRLLEEEFDKFAVSSAGATGGELGD